MRAHVELLAALGVALSVGTGSAARTVESLDGKWEFSFNGGEFRTVEVPRTGRQPSSVRGGGTSSGDRYL